MLALAVALVFLGCDDDGEEEEDFRTSLATAVSDRPDRADRRSPTKKEYEFSGDPREIVSLTVGGAHICARADSGHLYCWGRNSEGQLGRPVSDEFVDEPAVVADLPPISAVSAGGAHTCAVAEDGGAYCWGLRNRGQLGIGFVRPNHPDVTHTPSSVVDVSVAELRDDGAARLECSSKKLSSVSHIVAGVAMSCALYGGSDVICWGYNEAGVLGGAPPQFQEVGCPIAVPGHSKAIDIDLNYDTVCVGEDGGVLNCWGSRSRFDSALNGTKPEELFAETQIRVPLDGDIVEVGVGDRFACALVDDGSVYCLGKNRFSQRLWPDAPALLVPGGPAVLDEPRRVPGVDDAIQLAVANHQACARTSSGEVFCWAGGPVDDDDGDSDDSSLRKIDLPAPAVDIAAGGGVRATSGSRSSGGWPAVTCALLEDQRLICWGWRREGLLENASPGDGGGEAGPFFVETYFDEAFALVEAAD